MGAHAALQETPYEYPADLESLDAFVSSALRLISHLRNRVRDGRPDAALARQYAVELAQVGLDADGWGFDDVYRLILELQQVLLEVASRNGGWTPDLGSCFESGLILVSELLKDCHDDYVIRGSVAQWMERLSRGGKS